MPNKNNIKVCRYPECNHDNKNIDITKDEYVQKGKMYYHPDCFKKKEKGEWKTAQQKADLQLFKNLWVDNISSGVVYAQLFSVLNNLLKKGFSSDYLVFALQYCINHKIRLKYPAGFTYLVDSENIKEAYERKKISDINFSPDSFKVAEDNTKEDDNTPKFTVTTKKPKGFNSIFKE